MSLKGQDPVPLNRIRFNGFHASSTAVALSAALGPTVSEESTDTQMKEVTPGIWCRSRNFEVMVTEGISILFKANSFLETFIGRNSLPELEKNPKISRCHVKLEPKPNDPTLCTITATGTNPIFICPSGSGKISTLAKGTTLCGPRSLFRI